MLTAGSNNWTTVPWVISDGSGAFPTDGGAATLSTGPAATPGALFANASVTLDTPITISSLTLSGSVAIRSTASVPLYLSDHGATVVHEETGSPLFAQGINGVIAGGGTAGLTKTGAGDFVLTGTNSYTGGTHINQGRLILSGFNSDLQLGATGIGNGLSFDGGVLQVDGAASWSSGRDIALGTAGGTIQVRAGLGSVTLNGVVSGGGPFNLEALPSSNRSVAITLTAASTYTGATNIGLLGNPTVTLQGSGSIASSAAYNFTGAVTLNNTSASVSDRLNDVAPLVLRGTHMSLIGNATDAVNEQVGAATLGNGTTTIAVIPNATGARASLTFADLTRTSFATLYVRGVNQGNVTEAGGTSAPDYGVRATAAHLSLIGGNGEAGATNMPVVPWAIGGTATTANRLSSDDTVGSSLLTYTSTGRFRPLTTAEYATSFGGNVTDNVRISASTAVSSTVTANALLFAPAAAGTLGGTGAINVTSGAVLYSPSKYVFSGSAVGVALNFGSAEGVVTATANMVLSSAISGTGGVTYASPSVPITTTPLPVIPVFQLFDSAGTANPSSSYTGDTRIVSGSVGFRGTVPAVGTNSTFGSGGEIVLIGGSNGAILQAMGASSVARDLHVIGTGFDAILSRIADPVAFDGKVTLDGDLYILAVGQGSVAFNGTVAGSGTLRAAGPMTIVSGDNTFSGGTTIGDEVPGATTSPLAGGTVVVGSDAALGTGPVAFASVTATTAIAGLGTAARTLPNRLVLNGLKSTFSGAAPLTFTGAVDLNGAGGIEVTNTATTTFAGNVAHGGISKTGPGVLMLTNPAGNTYAGGTIVSGGTLRVNNVTGSGTGAGAVMVAGGGTLGGAGSIAGAVLVAGGGRITAGAGDANVGVLTTGPQTWAGDTSGGRYIAKVTATSADRLVMSGLTVSASAGTPFLVSAVGAGVKLEPGQRVLIATDTNAASTSAGNPFVAALAAGTLALDLAGTTVSPATGQSLELASDVDAGGYELYVVSAPEPASLALAAVGSAGLLALRRRGSRRQGDR